MIQYQEQAGIKIARNFNEIVSVCSATEQMLLAATRRLQME